MVVGAISSWHPQVITLLPAPHMLPAANAWCSMHDFTPLLCRSILLSMKVQAILHLAAWSHARLPQPWHSLWEHSPTFESNPTITLQICNPRGNSDSTPIGHSNPDRQAETKQSGAFWCSPKTLGSLRIFDISPGFFWCVYSQSQCIWWNGRSAASKLKPEGTTQMNEVQVELLLGRRYFPKSFLWNADLLLLYRLPRPRETTGPPELVKFWWWTLISKLKLKGQCVRCKCALNAAHQTYRFHPYYC